MPTQTLTPKEVAQRLRCHVNRVYEMIHRGEIRAARLWPGAREYRITETALEEFIARIDAEAAA